jgi:hypothetical protein
MLKPGNIISPFQRELLEAFSQLPDANQFFLTGGTALAEYYFQHRYSYDLDIFTSKQSVIPSFSTTFEYYFSNLFTLEIVLKMNTFCEYTAAKGKEKVKIQLAYDSPFRFKSPVLSNTGVMINDYDDIIIDKLLAFFGRCEPRDTVDLYFILKAEPLDKLLKLAGEKDPGFDIYWLAMAFDKVSKFPDNIKDWPVEMLKPVDIPELKKEFMGYAKKLMEGLNEKK